MRTPCSETHVSTDAGERTLSWAKAVAISGCIIAPCIFVAYLSADASRALLLLAVVGSSLWAAIDSYHLKAREYQSPIAAHPFVLFSALLALWIVVFPAYLVIRSRIKAEKLAKASNLRERRLAFLCMLMWCVPLSLLGLAYLADAVFLRL